MNITAREQLAVLRKRRGLDQAEAARKLKIGIHELVAIEKGRLVPAPVTPEGIRIASAIEKEFGIAPAEWLRLPLDAAA
jgi:transcriptional regulator with XRE-family HTH domain